MKTIGLLFGCFLLLETTATASVPIITIHPTNQVATPSSDVTFVLFSPNATSYQWRHNGVDIPLATNALLVITNAQTNNNGYYMVVAKNDTGWTPSQMGYLSVVGTSGRVTFKNQGTPSAIANYQAFNCGLSFTTPITNGTALLYVGPALEFMTPVASALVGQGPFPAGYYPTSIRTVTNVAPGQEAFYRVDITYVVPCGGTSFTQPSRTLKLIVGGNEVPPAADPTPAVTNLTFPNYIEWPDPSWNISPADTRGVSGETLSLKYGFYTVSGNQPTSGIQWRKDGKNFGPPQGGTLTLTNLTASDAGVYDVYSPSFLMPAQKLFLSVQTTGGQGLFKDPRKVNSNFVCNLEGASGRRYQILSSTNLTDWSGLIIVSNATGTVSFTNAMSDSRQYYRAMLLP